MEDKIHRLCEYMRAIEKLTYNQTRGLNATEVAVIHGFATGALKPHWHV